MLQIFSFGRKTITNTLSVCIKTNTGNTINVDLDPKWHIGNVKQLVADELGLRADELKIIFAGKELSNNTLIEVGVDMDDKLLNIFILLQIGVRSGSTQYFACC